MSNKKTIPTISSSEASKMSVSALAVRPNDASRFGQGGLSTKALQEWFDKLPNLVREKFNKIAEMLADTDAAKYITLGGEDNALGETLFDFLALFGPRGDGITDKNISDLIETLYQKEDSTVNVSTPIKEIVHDIERRIVKANAGRVTNARFDVASNSLVISFAGGNDLSVDLSAISVGEGVSGEIERLKDTDADHERRISNLEEHISDDYFVTDDSVAYEKAVPARACSSAKLLSLGGMTYKCKNLWQSKNETFTIAGVTITCVDGVYTFNGTATSSAVYVVGTLSLKDGAYSISANNPKNNDTATPMCQVYSVTTMLQLTAWDSTNNAQSTVTIVGADDYNMRVRVESGVTYDNFVLKPMLNEGTTALPFEPWYEGLRDSKVTEIKSNGANILDGSKFVEGAFSVRGITCSYDADTQIYTINGTMDSSANIAQKRINLKGQKDSTYTIRTEVVGGSATVPSGSSALIYFGSADSITGGYTNWHDCSVVTSQVKSKVLPHEYISNVWFYFTQGVVFNNLKIKIMLAETTDTTLPYKPYREPISYPIPAEIQAIEGYGKDGFNIDLEKQEYTYGGVTSALPARLESIIKVEGGGSLEFVNEYKNPVPSAVKYLLKEESAV